MNIFELNLIVAMWSIWKARKHDIIHDSDGVSIFCA